MFAPSISGLVGVNAQPCTTDHRLVRRSLGGGGSLISDHSRPVAVTVPKQRDPESIRGFTLLELLIVVGIIGLLLVLIAPAFTTIKGGTDVTSAAYTIQGVLDTARTYAKANNTYTWVGFLRRIVAEPTTTARMESAEL